MNKVKLKYDPNLSIKENAAMCGVSESAVRKYMLGSISGQMELTVIMTTKSPRREPYLH